jgi:hypothetical protein
MEKENNFNKKRPTKILLFFFEYRKKPFNIEMKQAVEHFEKHIYVYVDPLTNI